MKVALITIAHVVLITIAELELAKARVYMGRAQEDWSRLAAWGGKRTLKTKTMPQVGAQEERGRGTRTLAEQTLSRPRRKDQRGPRRLIGKPGGYYVGNEPRSKQWLQKRRKEKRPGKRVSQISTSPARNHSETGMEGKEKILPEAGTLHNGSVTMGSGGTNNMEMTGGMGGHGRMMDPMSAGMMGMGSMGMGMGYGMTMGMGMGLTAMMAPTIIRQATSSLNSAATGITNAVIAAQRLQALDSKRAKRSKRKDSEDMKDSKDGDEDTDKKSTSKSDNSGTDDGKNEDSKKEDEKKKGEESENGNSTAANKEEESRNKPK